MREASWRDCIEKGITKYTTPNIPRIKSLKETAEARIAIVKEITKENCNFVFEDYYTSLLELLQALIIKDGYNVLNHVCIGYYIKDILKDEYLFKIFNDLRYKRNSLTYYGNRMDFISAKSSINKAKSAIKEIKQELKKWLL